MCDSFDEAFAAVFSGGLYVDVFFLGFGLSIAFVWMLHILPVVFDLVIDLIRVKLGLPFARYVRWVKEEAKCRDENA